MYITPQEYLNISDRVKLYKQKIDELLQENRMLKQVVCKKDEALKLLHEEKKEVLKKQKQASQKLTDYITNQSKSIQKFVQQTNKKQRQFIESQIIQLSQDSTALKLKNLEVKMQENKRKYQKYQCFYQKIKTLYHSCTKKKQTPSFQNLAIWVEEGRQHEIVANDFTQGIVELMMGSKPTNSSKRLNMSNNKSHVNTSIFQHGKNQKKSLKNISSQKIQPNNVEASNFEQNQKQNLNIPKNGFLAGILAAAKQKELQNKQEGANTQNPNNDNQGWQ